MLYSDTKRDFYVARNFFSNIIVHLSSTEEGYYAIQSILMEIKKSAINDTYIYYINKSLQDAENSYIQLLIAISTLEESIELVESLK